MYTFCTSHEKKISTFLRTFSNWNFCFIYFCSFWSDKKNYHLHPTTSEYSRLNRTKNGFTIEKQNKQKSTKFNCTNRNRTNKTITLMSQKTFNEPLFESIFVNHSCDGWNCYAKCKITGQQLRQSKFQTKQSCTHQTIFFIHFPQIYVHKHFFLFML